MKLAPGPVAGLPRVDDDTRLVESLRAGDERAFAALIDRYHTVMLRVATVYVRDRAVAQDVVPDTWLGVRRWQTTRVSIRRWLGPLAAA